MVVGVVVVTSVVVVVVAIVVASVVVAAVVAVSVVVAAVVVVVSFSSVQSYTTPVVHPCFAQHSHIFQENSTFSG